MEFRILGVLEVAVEGRPIRLAAARERALLIRLLLEAPRAVSVDRLVEDLWGDEPSGSANVSVRVHVSRLRKAFAAAGAPETILTEHPGYRLALGSGDVIDARRFSKLVEAGGAALSAGKASDASAALSEALSLWRGQALADVADLDFARSEAARLEEARLVALEQRIEADLVLGRHASLAGELEALTKTYSLRERLWGQRMIALYRSGRQAEALSCYQELRTTLAEELGIDPSPELVALEAQVLAQAPELAGPVPSGPSASDLPSGVVTFLLTDIEGSSGLWEAHPKAMPAALERHENLIAEHVGAHDGHTIKSKGEGDATVSVFRRASDAGAAAVALSNAFQAEAWPEGLTLRVRLALHTGEAHERGGDYFGPALNRAARLRSLACGAQVLVSQATAELLRDHLPEGATLADMGWHELKGLSRAEYVYELVPPGAEPRSVARPPAESRTIVPAPPVPGALAGVARGVFVGRERELLRLNELWASVKAGEGRAAFLAGEPGIGKTRLASEFANSAHADGALVLYGRCDEESLVPYQSFVEALRTYVNATRLEDLRAAVGPTAGELTRIVPELRQRIADLPEPITGDPKGDRYRLFEAVADLLGATSRRTPIVLVLDDLHWADKPTLLLLKHVLRSSAPPRMLVVATYRETELARTHPLADVLADLRRDQLFERLALKGLDETGVAGLMEALSGEEAAPTITRAVYDETEGNPFFVVEVTRHLSDAGVSLAQEGAPVESIGIPEGIREVVGRRLARLSPVCDESLTAASVVGREFSVDVLARVTDRPADALLTALEEATNAGLVSEVPGPGSRFGFTHALIRETLYEELSGARRNALHRRVGDALEAVFSRNIDPHLPEIARHLYEAARPGDEGQALEYATRAGDHAMRLIAYEEAAEHYRRALHILEMDPSAEATRKCELLLSLGGALMSAGEGPSAKESLMQAATLARSVGDAEYLARAALTIARPWILGGGIFDREKFELLEEAERALGSVETPLRARVLGVLSLTYLTVSRERTHALRDEAERIARRVGDPATLAFVLTSTRGGGVTHTSKDNFHELVARAEEILRLAAEIDDKELEASARTWRIQDFFAVGDFESADAEIEVYRRLASELRQPLHLRNVHLNLATRAFMRGDFAEGERLADESRAYGERLDPDNAFMLHFAQMLHPRRMLGRNEENKVDVDRAKAAWDLQHARGEQALDFPVVTMTGALIECDLGNVDAARRGLEAVAADGFAAFTMASPLLTFGAPHAALVCHAFGDADRARVLYELLRPFAGLHAGYGVGVGYRWPFTYYLGLLAYTTGELDTAVGHFEDALEVTNRVGAIPYAAHVKYEFARTLLKRGQPGDRERALEVVNSAHETAARLGMPPLKEKTETLLRPPVPSALEIMGSSVFVARDQELGALKARWNEVVHGARRAVLLSGEPGIGKTRLPAEIARLAHDDGGLVLYGRSDEDAGIPNQPFVEALTSYVARCPITELEEHARTYGADLAQLVPELSRRLPDLPPSPTVHPDSERYRVFEAVSGFLGQISAKTPVVLVLDDLHWATKPTLLLLKHLLRADIANRLLIVGTYRDTDLDRSHPLAEALADFAKEGGVERLSLAGFDEKDVYAYLEAAGGQEVADEPAAIEFVHTLYSETEGNPFFIREVLSHLAESGVAHQVDGRWISDAAAVEKVGLPQGVREAVTRRLSRLSDSANRALAVAAIAGTNFSVDVLEKVPEAGAETVIDALEEARAARIVVEGERPEQYRFAHSLIRQTLLAEISSIRRVRIHRRIAEAMEMLYARDLEHHLPDLARHFFEAAHGGDVAKAVEYSTRAGEQAMSRVAYEEAAEYFRRALEAMSLGEPSDEERADLLLALGEAETRKGNAEEAKQQFREAAELAKRIRSTDRLARAALGYGLGQPFGLWPFIPDPTLVVLIEEALDALGPADHVLRVHLLARLAPELEEPTDMERLDATSLEALEMADRLGDSSALLVALHTRLLVIGSLDRIDERRAGAERLLAIAEESGNGDMVMRAHQIRLRLFVELNEPDRANLELDAMTRVADELRQPTYRWLVAAIRSAFAMTDGDFEQGDRLAQEAWKLGQGAYNEKLLQSWLGILTFLRVNYQGFDQAYPMWVKAMEQLPPSTLVTSTIMSAYLEAGDIERASLLYEDLARNDFEDIFRVYNWASVITSVVNSCGALRDSRRAALLYERLLPLRDLVFTNSSSTLVINASPVVQSLAILAGTIGRFEEAEALFEQAIHYQGLGSRVYGIYSRRKYAEMLIARDGPGDRNRARELLNEALEAWDAIGASGYANTARELLARL